MRAMKRGGGQQIVSFDDQLTEAEAAMNATVSFERRQLI